MKWGNWVLIFTNFVPISLIVSLEMVKFFQGMGIVSDDGTYSQEYDIRASVQTSNLNEELGQVEYIFSDKTGTLTKNLMDYKSLTVGGKAYGVYRNMSDQEVSKFPQVTNVDFRDKAFFTDLQSGGNSQNLNEFLMCLALCHTVVTDTKNGQLIYNASSPDELALLNFARFSGYQFMETDQNNNMIVRIGNNKEVRYQLLHVLEFNSTRKRMSVILQDQNKNILLYCKGADSVIEKRMKPLDRTLKENTWKNLETFAQIGLRTLILAKRTIPYQVYQQWSQKYNKASSAIQNRDELVTECEEEIERELELVGGTAIEDKLQEDVGPTISFLKQAGIKVWVLTGDKIETAINIGYSCQLLNDSLIQIVIDGVDERTVANALQQGLQKIKTETEQNHALIISGDALIIAMRPEYSKQVMDIADKCEAVVACRVSPKQKQEIVTLVRTEKPKVTTLAIGDGANDVNMITAAHVGIGIKGVEGQQAARASDYSVGEFRMLRRLTLYHGRECYRRNSRLVTYNFYKNMMLVLPQFWWAINNGFSAVTLYDPLMYQSYNLFYTSLPIVLYAIFDEEFTGDYLVQNPDMYQIGLKSQLFNYKVFVFWVLNGAVQAFIEGIISYPMLETSAIARSGQMGTFWATGTAVLGYSVLNSNFKIVLFTNTYTIAIIFALVGSVVLFELMYVLISAYMVSADAYNTFSLYYGNGAFYLSALFMFGATTLIDLAITRWEKFSQYAFTYGTKQKASHVELVEDVNLKKGTTQFGLSSQAPGQSYRPPQSPMGSQRLSRGYTGYAYSKDER